MVVFKMSRAKTVQPSYEANFFRRALTKILKLLCNVLLYAYCKYCNLKLKPRINGTLGQTLRLFFTRNYNFFDFFERQWKKKLIKTEYFLGLFVTQMLSKHTSIKKFRYLENSIKFTHLLWGKCVLITPKAK